MSQLFSHAGITVLVEIVNMTSLDTRRQLKQLQITVKLKRAELGNAIRRRNQTTKSDDRRHG